MRIESIYDLTALEAIHSVEKSLYGLSDLLHGVDTDALSDDARGNISELIQTLADMQQSARIELEYNLKEYEKIKHGLL